MHRDDIEALADIVDYLSRDIRAIQAITDRHELEKVVQTLTGRMLHCILQLNRD